MIRFSGDGIELYGRIRPRLGKYRRNYAFWEMGGHAGSAGETSSALIADESATPTQITSAAALESH
jgi:hypothetical protein